MFCPNCGTSVNASEMFCPNCGTGLAAASASGTGSPPASTAYGFGYSSPQTGSRHSDVPVYHAQPEERVKRVVGYLIDVIPMLLLTVLHLLPVFGWMLYGLLHIGYWLLRDINGASPGKLVMKSFVANADGTPASTQQRILRNVPLAIPGLIGLIPLVGLFVEIPVALAIFAGEAIMLLATGRRFGDRLAGTDVFRN